MPDVSEEISAKQREINRLREETSTGSLVGGIICTVLGSIGLLYSVIFLIVFAGFSRLADDVFGRYIGGSVFGIIISLVFLIIGIGSLRAFAEARRERNYSIHSLEDDIQNLRIKAAMPSNSSAASRSSSNYYPVTMSGGRWRCVCGRVNEPYVGTCACGRTKDVLKETKKSADKEKAAEKKEAEKAETGKKDQEQQAQSSRRPVIDFEALRELKSLLDDDIITQEEFDRKKKEYLGDTDVPAADPEPTEEAKAQEPSDQKTEPDKKMRYCPKCGKASGAAAKFCASCGYRFV